MKRPKDIAEEYASMRTIQTLTGAYESLASMRISQIKNQVTQAEEFFEDLWRMYSQIRVDDLFRFGREQREGVSDKQLLIAVTAEGGFSGDIDQRLIREMLAHYKPEQHDIVIIGRHGALQLLQEGVQYKKYFKLPVQDHNINVVPLVQEVRGYKNAVVYYQSYESLTSQSIRHITLAEAVQDAGRQAGESDEVISEATYIFEPSSIAVAAHLERTILNVTLSQVILDSKLAQYASRFRAMRMANDKAGEASGALNLAFNRAKRAQSDERLKEIINGLKKAGAQR